MRNISNFKPLRDNVFVEDLDHGAQVTRGGVILLDDDMKDRGIHPRWCRVYAIGPEVEDISVGEWLLVKHGRWTNHIMIEVDSVEKRVWRIEWPEAVLLATYVDPREHILLKDAAKSHAHHPHYLGSKIVI